MVIFKLQPAGKNYLWGGSRLAAISSKGFTESRIAESWELSCHLDGLCSIASGPAQGQTLQTWLCDHSEALGTMAHLAAFPLLIKIIDAREALSVQVHPDDAYAWLYENQPGKTEMWYVLNRDPGAFLYLGFVRSVTPQEIRIAIQENKLTDLLRRIPVEPGDTFLIQPGTVHAIGGGILLAEVQQSSNVTYRLFDYNRRDDSGNLRDLHLDKALQVLDLDFATEPMPCVLPVCCPYFRVERHEVAGEKDLRANIDCFTALFIVSGQGILRFGDDELPYAPYDTFFVGASSGIFYLQGNGTALSITVPSARF